MTAHEPHEPHQPATPDHPTVGDSATCYFCTRPASWLYVCPQFKIAKSVDTDDEHTVTWTIDATVDPWRWPACEACAALVEAHDLEALVDKTMTAVQRATETQLQYEMEYEGRRPMVQGWYWLFDKHRMADRMAFG